MPLETAQHIHGLDKTWPQHDDPHSQGDDHLRLIKSVLLEDLGSLQGPLTLTADEINGLVQKVADALPLAGGIMSGDIRMSSGSGVSFTLSDATNDFAKIRSELDKIIIEIIDPADGTTVLKTVTIGPDGIETATPDGTNPKELATVEYVDAGLANEELIMREVLPASTNAGTFIENTWVERNCSTVEGNTIPGASISGHVVTLPPGRYEVEGSAPALRVHAHQTRVYDLTNDVNLMYGSTEHSEATSGGQTRSFLMGYIDIASDSRVVLQHKCERRYDNSGLGERNQFGIPGIFSMIKYRKVG